ncbi:MAG: hypothetical protein JNL62_23795 [Bryobacterales bacterium]|nr:hypothetical protein [Bryobacterales bacterium]
MAAAVAYRLLTGGIHIRGLLLDSEGAGHSPARLQLLLLTVFGAMQYLAMVAKDPSRLPEPSQELLLLIGGSHAVFMGSKALPLFASILSERLLKK